MRPMSIPAAAVAVACCAGLALSGGATIALADAPVVTTIDMTFAPFTATDLCAFPVTIVPTQTGTEKEYFDKVWYVRSLIHEEKVRSGESGPPPPDLAEQIKLARQKVEEKYGIENVGPWDDWGWGFVHGKLSALRWVLGDEWDFLDT